MAIRRCYALFSDMAASIHPLASLLSAWISGDVEVTEALLAVLRLELEHQARLHAEQLEQLEPSTHADQAIQGDHLEPRRLIQDAFLRLVRAGALEPGDRSRFFTAAARMLRRMVVDTARVVEVGRYGWPAPPSLRTADPGQGIGAGTVEIDLLELDRAMSRLEAVDHSQAEVVELRFFGGLSTSETAALLALGIATVERLWNDGRCWLLEHLGRAPAPRRGLAAAPRLARRTRLD
jgi:RNA polymerase sigma factor (TIGR02999 family)